jgi:hypothetical protein
LLQQRSIAVKRNLYDVNIRPYKVLDGKKGSDNPNPATPDREPGRHGAPWQAATGAAQRRRQ